MPADDFPLRLLLLSQGELPPGPVDEWMLVWFCRDHPAAALVGAHHASPRRRALAVRRHRPRAHHSLRECLEGIGQAAHPQLRLVWLLQARRHQAVPDLLSWLANPSLSEDLVSALCWILGQFGREIVLQIGDRFPSALRVIKDRYCRALWYLGTEARGCERWFHHHDTPWSRAVLYRLEGWGAQQLMDWKAAPLWLDERSLKALAEKAFSWDLEERYYSLDALQGWGPHLSQAGDLLETLGMDPDPEFSRAALSAMRQLGFRPKFSTLTVLARRPDINLDDLCDDIRPEDLQKDPEFALRLLQSTGLHSIVLCLLGEGHSADVRRAALQAFVRVGCQSSELIPYLKDPELRQCAAQLLVRSAPPEVLLPLLEQRQIRQEFRRSSWLLYALVFWEPQHFEQLQQALVRLDPALLEQLSLESIQWHQYSNFNSTQRRVAHALIELHQRFPEEFLHEMLYGLVPGSEPVQLLVQYGPGEQLAGWLARIWARRQPSERDVCWRALYDLQKEGWLALVEQLDHPQLLVAHAALRRLADWTSAREWLLECAPQILSSAVHPVVLPRFGEWLVSALFPPQTDVSEALDPLALALLPLAGDKRNLLDSYLYRCRPSARLLQNYQNYPPDIRLCILQWLRMWRPRGILTRVRRLKRDQEPYLRLARLQLLDDLGGLTPAEKARLRKLAEEDLRSAGSQPDVPETRD